MALTGDKVTAMQTFSDVQVASGTTISATKTSTLTGGTACGVSFIGPASGVVVIFNVCDVANSGANFSMVTVRVRTGLTIGSGADVVADSDDEALYRVGAGPERQMVAMVVTGLTPGAAYNAQQRFQSGAGTATFFRKVLIVSPQV